MKLHRSAATVLFSIVLMGCSMASAQPSAAETTGTQSSTTIAIPILITGAKDRLPRFDVAPTDLVIEIDKRPLQSTPTITSAQTQPLRLGVLIDKSGSQADNIYFGRGLVALYELMKKTLRSPDDRLFVQDFAREPGTPTGWMSSEEVQEFRMDVSPKGYSALFDTIVQACEVRMKPLGSDSRRVLLVFTDGADNASKSRMEDAIASAIKTRTIVIFIDAGFWVRRTMIGDYTGRDYMLNIAERTGGHAFVDLERETVRPAFSDALELIGGMQELTFKMESVSPGVHRLKIKSKKRGVKISAPATFLTEAPDNPQSEALQLNTKQTAPKSN